MVGSAPSSRQITSAVYRGLRLDPNITGNMVSGLTFEPSIGIVAAKIDRLGLDIRSFREPLKRSIQHVLAPSFQRNFDVGGRPKWKPLAEDTINIRANLGVGSKILIRSGALRKVAGQLNIWDISMTTAIIRSLPERVWYGAVQQGGYGGNSMKARIGRTGSPRAALESIMDEQVHAMRTGTTITSRGGSGIPARPFVLFQQEDEEGVYQVFLDWLNERVLRSWAGLL